MAFKLKNIANYLFARDDGWKNSEANINYIVADNGTFEFRKTQLGKFVSKTESIPHLEEVEEGVFLDIPKIPFKTFDYMTAWHRKVYKKDKTESTIMIFYNEEDGYSLFVPEQNNAGATSNYLRDDDPAYVEMLKNNILVMVAHSHPWAGKSSPGPSGTDNNDEKEALLYMITNNVEGIPNVFVSTCPGGKRIELNFFDIFDNPMEAQLANDVALNLIKNFVPEREIFAIYCDIDSIEIPEEWMNKHKVKFSTSSLGGGAYTPYKRRDPKGDFPDMGIDEEDSSYYKQNFLDYGKFDNFDYYGKKNVDLDMDEYNAAFGIEDGMDEISVEYEDVRDFSLDLGDLEFAKLISSLIVEGKGGAIKACLIANEDVCDYTTKDDLSVAYKTKTF